MPKPDTERSKTLYDRKEAEGLKRVPLWVHNTRVDEIRAIAAGMREPKGDADMGCDPEKSWPNDFSLENGNYYNICCICDEYFIGHKRRNVCRQCHEVAK